MRVLKANEMRKRGCIYCLHHRKEKLDPEARLKTYVCKYKKCPYHELDKYDSYSQYLKNEASTFSLKRALLRMVEVGMGNVKKQ